MLSGKSVLHVNQSLGRCFRVNEIAGYYNDMTEKVSMEPHLLDTNQLPHTQQPDGRSIIFPVAVFQYALGCYDLFLLTKDERYRIKFWQCVDWTYIHQDQMGRWDNFSFVYPNNPYGAMAQGEAVSVLVRAYKETGDAKYLSAAKFGIDFMLQSISDGGTTRYAKGEIIFLEYTHLPAVLNGWIFAWFGLYDYVLASKDHDYYYNILNLACNSLMQYLPKFRNNYWSKYDLDYRIASPFYHNLHIAQMEAMFQLTGKSIFDSYATLWRKQQKNILCKSLAFCKKAMQKIAE